MDASAPTFLTHRELDLFLGGGERGPKKRQRLRRENLLPDPADLGRVKRINIAMFPRFALAGLVGDLTRLDGAPECLSDLTRQALGLRVFSQLTKAVLVSVRAMDGWRFDQLIDDVESSHSRRSPNGMRASTQPRASCISASASPSPLRVA